MQKILVIDYGSQYTHLITSRLRSLWVYAEIIPAPHEFINRHSCEGRNLSPYENIESLKLEINKWELKWIILSWWPNSVYDPNGLIISKDKSVIESFFWNLDPASSAGWQKGLWIPILGICYGHQLVAHSLWWKVEPWKVKEYGKANAVFDLESDLFKWISWNSNVWMSHWDEVTKLPEWFKKVAHSTDEKWHWCVAWLENHEKKIYTLQFHPEVKHTEEWMRILSNFISICWISKDWSMKHFLDLELKEIKEKVWNKNVFLFISWWVDSTVAYFILKEAIWADRIYPVFVDTGFMRKDERKKVESMLTKAWVKHLKIIDASERFISALKWVVKPEEKRKIIWDLFIQVQKDAVKDLWLDQEHWLLGQGTIYPDTIESWWTKHADKIKTHHNRVPEIEAMIEKWLIIEPLAKLYKDEVREIGKLLWLPDELVWRHPFPGPGLAVRILCSEKTGK